MSSNSDSANSSLVDDSLDQAIDRSHNYFFKLFRQCLRSFEILRFIALKYQDLLRCSFYDGSVDECFYVLVKVNMELNRAIDFLRERSVQLAQESLLLSKATLFEEDIIAKSSKTMEYFIERFTSLFYLLECDPQRVKFCNHELLNLCKAVQSVLIRSTTFGDMRDLLKAARDNEEYAGNIRHFNRLLFDNILKLREIADDLQIFVGAFNPIETDVVD